MKQLFLALLIPKYYKTYRGTRIDIWEPDYDGNPRKMSFDYHEHHQEYGHRTPRNTNDIYQRQDIAGLHPLPQKESLAVMKGEIERYLNSQDKLPQWTIDSERAYWTGVGATAKGVGGDPRRTGGLWIP